MIADRTQDFCRKKMKEALSRVNEDLEESARAKLMVLARDRDGKNSTVGISTL